MYPCCPPVLLRCTLDVTQPGGHPGSVIQMWAALTVPLTSFYIFVHMHTQSQTLTASGFINRALLNLFSSATVLDWLALDAWSHRARAIDISSTWLFVCWCWGSKFRLPNSGPQVCMASTLSTAISPPFSPFLLYSSAARTEGKTSLCGQLVQNVPVLL